MAALPEKTEEAEPIERAEGGILVVEEKNLKPGTKGGKVEHAKGGPAGGGGGGKKKKGKK